MRLYETGVDFTIHMSWTVTTVLPTCQLLSKCKPGHFKGKNPKDRYKKPGVLNETF